MDDLFEDLVPSSSPDDGAAPGHRYSDAGGEAICDGAIQLVLNQLRDQGLVRFQEVADGSLFFPTIQCERSLYLAGLSQDNPCQLFRIPPPPRLLEARLRNLRLGRASLRPQSANCCRSA